MSLKTCFVSAPHSPKLFKTTNASEIENLGDLVKLFFSKVTPAFWRGL